MARTKTPSSEFLLAGLDCLPEGFVLYDKHDRLVFCNAQYRNLYPTASQLMVRGVRFEEVVRASVEHGQFKIAGDTESWIGRRLAFHRRGRGFFEQHLSDGTWLRVTERKIPSGGTASIRSDVTLLKKREQQLLLARRRARTAMQAKSQFIAMMAHEIKTALNAIMGLSQLLQLERLSRTQHRRVANILESGGSLLTVLDDVLNATRVQAGKLALVATPVSPSALLDACVVQFRPMARKKGLNLQSELAADVPSNITSDPVRLRQVLVNLVSNAIKYTDEGLVKVSIGLAATRQPRGRWLEFSIEDSGRGISKRDLQRLFSPYFRGTATATTRTAGTGLGLSICKKLILEMGGRIGVESRIRKGSRFWFRVPLKPAAQAPEPNVNGIVAPPPHATTRLKILVVDDDELNLAVLEGLLGKLGHRPVLLKRPDLALATLEREDSDVVLLDIMMPRISGPALLRKIRAHENPHIAAMPVWAVSAHTAPEDVERYLTQGFNKVIAKPVMLGELAEALAFFNAHGTRARRISGQSGKSRAPRHARPRPDQRAAPAVLERLRSELPPAAFSKVLDEALRSFRTSAATIEKALTTGRQRGLGPLFHRLQPDAEMLGFAVLAAAVNAFGNPGRADERKQLSEIKRQLQQAIPVLQRFE